MRKIGSLVLAGLMAVMPGMARAQAGTLIVGSGIADQSGACAIDVQVDAGLDPQFVADQLKDNLSLSAGATPQSISVENGIAHVECAQAQADAVVELWLPADVARDIGALGEAPEGSVSRASIIGGILLAVAGIALGVCVAAGCFDGDDDGPRNVPGGR